MSVERQAFPRGPEHLALLRTLLAQDGSTTRICEAIARRRVQVLVHRQIRTTEAPSAVRDQLGGERWLERVTSLVVDGKAMMDNLSYTRLDAVPEWFLEDLDRGQAPIGYLLDRLFVRRENIEADEALRAGLWSVVGVPDDAASRAYRIVTPDGPLMAIFEVFRAAMTSAEILEQGAS